MYLLMLALDPLIIVTALVATAVSWKTDNPVLGATFITLVIALLLHLALPTGAHLGVRLIAAAITSVAVSGVIVLVLKRDHQNRDHGDQLSDQ